MLNPDVFYSPDVARTVIAQWVHQYNHSRPYPSLNDQPPVPEANTPALSQNRGPSQGA